MKTIKTYLPLFSGFYGSHFEDDFYYQFDNDECEFNFDFDFNDLDFDFNKYYLDLSKQITSKIEDELIFLKLVTECNFESLQSPKYYNYSNDSINIEIIVSDENIKQIQTYLLNNSENFKTYLKNKYTSCDGFTSFYSNNFEDWVNFTENFTDFSNTHYLGSILNFILLNEEIEEYTIYSDINTLFYTEYLTDTEENKTFLDLLEKSINN